MNILVTGAAGYIGSIVTEKLIEAGNEVFALDNLQQGHREAVAPGASFIHCDLNDEKEVEIVFSRNKQIDAVIHLAAESLTEESMKDPARYFKSNVVYGLKLLDAMIAHGVNKIVFSSSASVYGNPVDLPVTESSPNLPISPYGESKLIFEKLLYWYNRAKKLDFIALRYFNVAGASVRFGEDHRPETHLIANVIKVAMGQADSIPVFGTDYPTNDGTCIRDYIHVLDVAQAHLLALRRLNTGNGNKAYNLGNGTGYSVMDIVKAARKITGSSIPVVENHQRSGDPPILVANSTLSKTELGWQAYYTDIESIISSAWQWQKQHPAGYKE